MLLQELTGNLCNCEGLRVVGVVTVLVDEMLTLMPLTEMKVTNCSTSIYHRYTYSLAGVFCGTKGLLVALTTCVWHAVAVLTAWQFLHSITPLVRHQCLNLLCACRPGAQPCLSVVSASVPVGVDTLCPHVPMCVCLPDPQGASFSAHPA